ncbi:MAG TPA: group 1 truncated hemoglobin [Methylomirabilota bacterium]|jgi:hemoglobin
MGRSVRAVGLLVVMVGAVACATAAPSKPSLYKRLGGREGIRGVVDDFVGFLVADPRVNARFKDMKPADVERLKTNVSDQVCEATGGPCSYLGKDMKAAHKGMNITEAEWNATLEDLVKALDKRNVPKPEQQELLGLLAPMKKDIVGQ